MTQKEIAHQFLKMAASGNVQAAYDQQIISNSPNENGLF
jgi:hypothetical protein